MVKDRGWAVARALSRNRACVPSQCRAGTMGHGKGRDGVARDWFPAGIRVAGGIRAWVEVRDSVCVRD